MNEALKDRVRDFWEANPCGSKFAAAEIGTRTFFEEIERHRYETEWHIPQVVRFERWSGRDVLEVGCGLGSEAVRFARAGARYTGVDLTERAIGLTRQRLEIGAAPGRLEVADAEALPFDEASFDLVYSHGVLHHTPDTQKAIDEVHRVLRPGGTAMVMLYHRHSYNYYVNIMFLRRLGTALLRFDWGPDVIHKLTGEDRGRLGQMQQNYRLDRRRFLQRSEFLNQNTDGAGNPLARVYSKREASRMFAAFTQVRTETHFLNKRWIPLLGRLLPRKAEAALARLGGWHLWIIAQK